MPSAARSRAAFLFDRRARTPTPMPCDAVGSGPGDGGPARARLDAPAPPRIAPPAPVPVPVEQDPPGGGPPAARRKARRAAQNAPRAAPPRHPLPPCAPAILTAGRRSPGGIWTGAGRVPNARRRRNRPSVGERFRGASLGNFPTAAVRLWADAMGNRRLRDYTAGRPRVSGLARVPAHMARGAWSQCGEAIRLADEQERRAMVEQTPAARVAEGYRSEGAGARVAALNATIDRYVRQSAPVFAWAVASGLRRKPVRRGRAEPEGEGAKRDAGQPSAAAAHGRRPSCGHCSPPASRPGGLWWAPRIILVARRACGWRPFWPCAAELRTMAPRLAGSVGRTNAGGGGRMCPFMPR